LKKKRESSSLNFNKQSSS